MGKAASHHFRAKHYSVSRDNAGTFRRLDEDVTRREKRVSNIENKYLPLKQNYVQKRKPGKLGKAHGIAYPAVYNISLFGMPAVGKSSLLNSISFAINGVFPTTQKAHVVPLGYKGVYPTRTQRLRVTNHMCIIAYDGNELTAILQHKDAVLETIRGQLCGSSKRRPELLPDGTVKGHARHSANKTHCAVVVIRPSKLDVTKEHYTLLINEIHKFTGYYPIGVITNFDALEQDKIKTTREFMHTNGINDIFEVESTHANPLPTKDQITLLDMIERCMYLADAKYEWQEEAT